MNLTHNKVHDVVHENFWCRLLKSYIRARVCFLQSVEILFIELKEILACTKYLNGNLKGNLFVLNGF